ncbi:hypothetical protein N7468_007775 [Penicillium chermesinum]|uniref:Zn(2)-C6 fungal-type domain-containing protein n=1 Tax=Penicillium chermesinum TaxID=63820 RepID=A0A9W9THU5_9EURO|nr:uncharacterized protein N7468_007775 [Penicillium chermesinum]KAJ5223233.1 hypothetical protein N7468_007775 [Penicillium chermesinum]
MEERRRQLRSCDPCRKEKKTCNAPRNRKDSAFGSCTNCTKQRKTCTFGAFATWRTDLKKKTHARPHATQTFTSSTSQFRSRSSNFSYYDPKPVEKSDAHWDSSSSSASAVPSYLPGSFLDPLENPCVGHSETYAHNSVDHESQWTAHSPDFWQIGPMMQPSDLPLRFSGAGVSIYASSADSCRSSSESTDRTDDGSIASSSSTQFTSPHERDWQKYLSSKNYRNTGQSRSKTGDLCIPSESTAHQYARATMTQNLIRIYHDSMENALSCWLTEHNCPYSDFKRILAPSGQGKAWGPSWSNRICIRVCQLDRASSSIRSRALSPEEDRTAAQVLHMSIIAFASQWTQHAQKGPGLHVPAPVDRDERSIREIVWNKARHALERSSEIPSFRIIFANIIFSLTQSPLSDQENKPLGQLLEVDQAPRFLEAANRQLFRFRYTISRLQRQASSNRDGILSQPIPDTIYEMSNAHELSQADPAFTTEEHCNTFNLLFWLGVMFDTLSSAMYRRPLVVSDEDSQITSAAPPSHLDVGENVDLDGWNMLREPAPRKPDIWDDFFLRPNERIQAGQAQLRWPCSYEEAASILSEATPVKVLLYRRVTQLQTLVYRGASRGYLEKVIQKTMLVYEHWNRTYQIFMLDCVANHDLLPPRIQSWYVILNCHWHLATMLLADMIESIDQGRLGCDAEREVRQATDLVTTLRTETAFAVGALARSSLQGQDSIMSQHFHDSLTEVAFLVEPWTVVLIHAFAKAGYISLEQLDLLEESNLLAECFRQNCEFCIAALYYLGRKSDMASMVARSMSKSLESKSCKGS